MISRTIIPAGILAAIAALAMASPSNAQVAGGDPAGSSAPALRGTTNAPKTMTKPVKKPASSHKAKTAQAKPAEKPKEMEPWAAVDPARAGQVDQQAATTAPMPGVAHSVPSASGPMSVGMKWNSNNDPNYGAMSTSGMMNQYNANVGGIPDPGTTVEPGVKFQF